MSFIRFSLLLLAFQLSHIITMSPRRISRRRQGLAPAALAPIQTLEAESSLIVPPATVTPVAELGFDDEPVGNDSSADSTNPPSFVNMKPHDFIRMRLQHIIGEGRNTIPTQCYNRWLSTTNFVHIIERVGGPFTKWDEETRKMSQISLEPNLLRNVKQTAIAFVLNGDMDDAANIIDGV